MNQHVTSGLPFDLSPKELEVCELICDGWTIAEIGLKFHLSPKTISTYKYRAREKMNVKTNVSMYKKLHPQICVLCKQALENMN